MQLGTLQANKMKSGTCPHGMPLGACPICNGMSGGGIGKNAVRKPGEMTWSQCAAIGAMLKAREQAKTEQKQELLDLAQKAQLFRDAIMNASLKLDNVAKFFTQNTPAIIAKPVNFILNNIIGGVMRLIAQLPVAVANVIQNIQKKFADISDKLTAMMGELKAAINKKVSDAFENAKKKIKSIFKIFYTAENQNDDKQIDETKKAFKLKTFIHGLYKKLSKDNENESN
ncbi:MAG: hypothetical protein R3Y28_03375 [Candidatus Gastranaerophilales bacterium]